MATRRALLFSTFVAVCLAIGSGAFSPGPVQPHPAQANQERHGDVNCSGAVDSIDAVLVLQFASAALRLIPCDINADVNGDGRIDPVDAALVLQCEAGLVDRLEPRPATALAVAISTGGDHSCALTIGGGVKCWGRNVEGQLGDGTEHDHTLPMYVVGLQGDVVAIAAGGHHTCALTEAGAVKCWGLNDVGQLGDGTTRERTSPVDVVGLDSGVTSIAAGGNHTCAVTAAGGVTCWGWGGVAAPAVETCTQFDFPCSTTPLDVAGLGDDVAAISAGTGHVCALTTFGGVKCWGENTEGQLGDGTTINRSVPVDTIGLSEGVEAIAANWDHTCALTDAGGLKCWGWNRYGQLGAASDETCAEYGDMTPCSTVPLDVTNLTSAVSAVAAGGGHNCALTLTNEVMCWGLSPHGQIGAETGETCFGGIPCSSVPREIPGLTVGVAAIAAGGRHSCALAMTGGILCWGDNDSRQLGAKSVDRCRGSVYGCSTTPVAVVGFGGDAAP